MKIMVYRNHIKVKGEISLYSLFRKLRTGFQMLSHIEWVSAYGSHISVASLLGVVGLILAVKDGRMGYFNSWLLLSERSTSSEKLYFVPGLRNLGNNCFLNVVLQSLASSSSFQRFLEEVMELQSSSTRDQVEDLPLLESLATLLEELSALHDRNITLNPQNVMSAMHQYIPQFQLTNEQDAAEAFLHLLSCLRDELSESYMPKCGSLADVAAPTSRILGLKRIKDTIEPERWRQQYLGPFNGVLGSFLTCRSCSSEIIMDFSFFHTLPLSPIDNTSTLIPDRCTLEDCIKKFLAPEYVENYSCNRCWHIAAIKFLSSVGGQQEEIRKLSCCSEQDSCECRNLLSLQALPWSNRFSHTYKQLSISHCPQILCLHLQRTSINAFGELVKLQGHISFPLFLNLSPFLKYDVGIQKLEVNKQRNVVEQQYPASISDPRTINIQSDPMKIKDDTLHTSPELRTITGSDAKFLHSQTHEVVCDTVPSKNHCYRLVSVVEHSGRAGSGHYVVYRGVRTQMEEIDEVGEVDILHLQWFGISDSQVYHCSEEDVLGADATLLFYEKI